MDVVRDIKKIFAQQNAVHMNTDKTVLTDAALIVTTTKLVTHFLEIAAGVRTAIKMQNVIKNAMMEPMGRTVRTNVGNVLML